MSWPPFNPSIGQVSLYPISAEKATINHGLSGGNSVQGHCIAYLRRVLYAYCGWNGTEGKANLNPSANWGPWSFNANTRTGLMGIQSLFGLPQDGIASHVVLLGETMSTWDAVDQLWAWNN